MAIKMSEKEITITWHSDDVLDRAKNINIDITEQQAIDILQSIKSNHDASLGINWDVIDSHIESYIKV